MVKGQSHKGKAKVFQMRKPAEVMKLMTVLIMVEVFEDRRHKSEKEKSRGTNRLDSYCLFEVKKGQLCIPGAR